MTDYTRLLVAAAWRNGFQFALFGADEADLENEGSRDDLMMRESDDYARRTLGLPSEQFKARRERGT
jgi:hypothetical protein